MDSLPNFEPDWNCTIGEFADFDNDGDLDALHMEMKLDDGRLSVFINNEGTFTKKLISSEMKSAFAGGVGDIDNDGKIDAFVYGDWDNLGLAVYQNTTMMVNVESEVQSQLSLHPNRSKGFVNIVGENGQKIWIRGLFISRSIDGTRTVRRNKFPSNQFLVFRIIPCQTSR